MLLALRPRRVYDAADRLTSVAYSDGQTPGVTYVYNNLNRRTTMTDGTGTITDTWDSLSRLTSSTDGAGATVGYGWDLAGRQTSIVYPGGATVTRGYDDAGRLTSVTDWLSHTFSFAYDANSNPTGRTLPNGTTETDAFDRADRLNSIDHRLSGSSFASFAYGRTDGGQITSVTPTGTPQANEAYTYSALDQLKTVNAGAYNYDAADNLTALPSGAALAYDTANQLTSSTLGGQATTYGYDSRGNRTSVTPPTGSATTLGWDQANRLKAWGTSATYAYDGDGLRTSKTVSGTTRSFVWDTSGSLQLLLKDGTDAYVYGPGGSPLERIAADGTVTYVHADQLGSVRALTDSTATVVGTFAFDAYGNPTGSTGSVSLPFGFAGEYRDAESGMVYLRARYYDPATGQFLSVDPAFAVTASRYGYVGGNPLNATDPLGLAARGTPTFTATGGGVTFHVMTESPAAGMSCEDYLAYLSAAGSYARAQARRAGFHQVIAEHERERRRAATLAEAAALQRQAQADRREAEQSVFSYAVRHPKFDLQIAARVVVDGYSCATGAIIGSQAGGAVGGSTGAVVGSVAGPGGVAAGAAIGGTVGAAAGAIGGCAAGVASAEVGSRPIG